MRATDYNNIYVTETVTIANGQSLSSSVETKGLYLAGISTPSAWTTASLSFQGSVDNTTYNNVYDNGGTEITATVDANRFITFANPIGPCPYLKIRSGTASTPVNQGAERILTLVFIDKSS